jgi:hypothetical protein
MAIADHGAGWVLACLNPHNNLSLGNSGPFARRYARLTKQMTNKSLINILTTECRTRMRCIFASYLGGLLFQISARRPAILVVFMVFLSLSRQDPG